MELEDLIHSIDIVEFIEQYVELEQRGSEFWGLSPFREENTPSFSVRRDPDFFYCFSSGKGGNLFTFVREYFQCNTKEAVEILKQYAGVDGEVFIPTEKLSASLVCKKFARHKSHNKESTATKLPKTHMDKYEKRLDKLQIWLDEGISMETLEKFEVRYDPFSDRLVYPIRNLYGDIVNVGGRTLDPDWKEKKLRKYNYFYKWGTIDVIYGLFEHYDSIKSKNEVIVFEGAKSVYLADTWGINNGVAILTSHLNESQMKQLIKLGCHVVFALDKDVEIYKDKNIKRLCNYVNVSFIYDSKNLLDEKDSPVDKGEEIFKQLYNDRFRYR